MKNFYPEKQIKSLPVCKQQDRQYDALFRKKSQQRISVGINGDNQR
jgi:hypothetical protein